jgi:hypothetical protein
MFRLLSVLAFALLLAGCGSGDGGGGGNADESPTPPPLDVLHSSADRMENLKSFHFVLSHKDGSIRIAFDLDMEKAEGDLVVPGRMKAKVDARLQGLPIHVDVVSGDGKFWVKLPFGGGFQRVSGFALSDFFNPEKGIPLLMRGATAASVTGREEIDGHKTIVVETDLDAGALADLVPGAKPGFPVRIGLWIGEQDYLLYRLTIDGAISSKDKPDVVRTINLSKFDESVTITLPDEGSAQ